MSELKYQVVELMIELYVYDDKVELSVLPSPG